MNQLEECPVERMKRESFFRLTVLKIAEVASLFDFSWMISNSGCVEVDGDFSTTTSEYEAVEGVCRPFGVANGDGSFSS